MMGRNKIFGVWSLLIRVVVIALGTALYISAKKETDIMFYVYCAIGFIVIHSFIFFKVVIVNSQISIIAFFNPFVKKISVYSEDIDKISIHTEKGRTVITTIAVYSKEVTKVYLVSLMKFERRALAHALAERGIKVEFNG